jgi:UDP-glucose:(heptosyl)LPS alpha-1,3-glucosyltransferase
VRIALVVERFEAGAGGVERAAFALASELARRGLAVTAVCRRAGEPPPGVDVRRLRVSAFWQPLRLLRFSREAAQATSVGFDLVHAFARTRHQHVYRAGGGSHAAYLERVYPHPALRARLSPRHRAILSIEEAVFRDRAQLVQCNARHCAREIQARYGVEDARLAVIYNGVDTESFRPEADAANRRALRSELDLAGARVALFAGDGFARKGLDLAIEGLAKAPGVILLVAGSGDSRRFVGLAQRLGVLERVRFLGRRTDLDRLYRASDLFVLPTRYDAFSNACLEAMASGLPVATTRANGAAELIVSGVNGLLIEDDVSAAYGWLQDGARLAELGRAARDTAEQHTWARHADAVLELYAQACGTS